MSASYELGGMFYYNEHSDSIAVCRSADAELIGNLINLLNNHDMMVMLSKK